MRILAADPGGTTGLVIMEGSYRKDPRVAWSAQVDFETMSKLVFASSLFDDIEAFVVEKFLITATTGKRSQQTDALQIIGQLRGRALVDGVPFMEQTPSDAKNVWTDEKLRDRGLWLRGRHERDALRHAMLFFQRVKAQ